MHPLPLAMGVLVVVAVGLGVHSAAAEWVILTAPVPVTWVRPSSADRTWVSSGSEAVADHGVDQALEAVAAWSGDGECRGAGARLRCAAAVSGSLGGWWG